MVTLAVIIVNYRTADLTVQCVKALDPARAAFPGLRAVVVDGGSGDGSAARLAAALAGLDWVTLLPLEVNGGFAFANNRAIALLAQTGALPDAIALINPDARVRPGALETMAAVLGREPRAGAVGAALIQEDGARQASAFRFPTIRSEFSRGARTGVIDRLLRVPPGIIAADAACEVPWVTGAAVMLRSAALARTGLFDEGFFLYFEETELMWRLRRQGWAIWHEPAALVVHDGGAATQIRDPRSGMPTARRMPRYWYESRRRYFVLALGRGRAVLAGLAFLAGACVWRARQGVVPRVDTGPLRNMRDFLAFGLWPRRFDARAAVPGLADPPRARPAWMAPAP